MNQSLINEFRVLAEHFNRIGDKGRSIAYGKAITLLRTVEFPITSSRDVSNIKGIGSSIREKIDEFLTTGKIRVAEEARALIPRRTEREEMILEFQTIHGIGPIRATELYDKEKITSLKQLSEYPHLTKQQRIGLKYREDLIKRIPRYDIYILNIILVYFLNRTFGKDTYRLEIAGSYRRKADTSGDIDCLLTSDVFTLKDVVKVLTSERVILETLGMKDEKFLGIVSCPSGGRAMRLDIEFLPKNEWGSALLYFTGSKEFNVHMRAHAKKKGLLLNEHGLFRGSEKVLNSPSEKDVFDYLELKYVDPKFR
jgi:DNA polymerase lambda